MEWLALNAYSLVYLAVLLLFSLCTKEQPSETNQSFLDLVALMIVLIVADSLGRIVGASDSLFFWVRAGNFISYVLNPMIILLWMRYQSNWMEISQKQRNLWLLPVLGFVIFNLILTIISEHTGRSYFFDDARRYRRGPLFLLRAALIIAVMVYAQVFVVANRKHISRRYVRTMLVFSLIPLVCCVLQTISYGLALEYAGVVVSLVAIYVFLQDKNVDVDYLTGAFSRRKLDFTLQELIREGRRFSEIMVDIDHFKKINDTYGHGSGDMALRDAVDILVRCFPKALLLARFGGDEFCVFLPGGDPGDSERWIHSVNKAAEAFNRSSGRPYHIDFSVGTAVYDPKTPVIAEQFQSLVDERLYKDKQSRCFVAQGVNDRSR